MFRNSVTSLRQHNYLANEKLIRINVVDIVFNIGTLWTIWQVWQELVFIQVTCQFSKLTMEYIIFSCTQSKGEVQTYLNLFVFWTSVYYVSFKCLPQVNTTVIYISGKLHLKKWYCILGGSNTRLHLKLLSCCHQ